VPILPIPSNPGLSSPLIVFDDPDNTAFPENVEVLDTANVPVTCKVEVGEVIPIPTLPPTGFNTMG
jgi:hypothetical protein